MDLLHVIILSIIEGVTEFLPISSTGHLILASNLLNIPQTEFLKTFEISIQTGAVFAVVNLYWKKFKDSPSLLLKALTGIIPTSIVGFIMYPIIKNYFLHSTVTVAISLILGGIIIILLEKYVFKEELSTGQLSKITYKQAFLTGLTQSIAVIPGISRAASSIFGGMLAGLNRKTATEFSFILALPTIIAASGFDLVQTAPNFDMSEMIVLILGIILSFTIALFTIKWFIRYVADHKFINFGWYRIVIGIIFLLIFINK